MNAFNLVQVDPGNILWSGIYVYVHMSILFILHMLNSPMPCNAYMRP